MEYSLGIRRFMGEQFCLLFLTLHLAVGRGRVRWAQKELPRRRSKYGKQNSRHKDNFREINTNTYVYDICECCSSIEELIEISNKQQPQKETRCKLSRIYWEETQEQCQVSMRVSPDNNVQRYNILLLCRHDATLDQTISTSGETNLQGCLMHTHCMLSMEIVNQANIQLDGINETTFFHSYIYVHSYVNYKKCMSRPGSWGGLLPPFDRHCYVSRHIKITAVTRMKLIFRKRSQWRGYKISCYRRFCHKFVA